MVSPEAKVLDVAPPEFVEGSSTRDHDQDLDSLAQQLKKSASFQESRHAAAWVSDEEADLWNF